MRIAKTMNRKKPTVEFDGPTLNGHPVLSVADVQAWFRTAKCDAPADAALAIAQMLNEYELLGALWKGTPALRKQRRTNASRLRLTRIAVALKSLQSELPIIIEDSREVFANKQSASLEGLVKLLDQVNQVTPRFQNFLPTRGRDVEFWHVVARKVGAKIIQTFKASTGRRVGFGKPTSPAVEILRSALAYLGVTKSPEAIVDAMRPKRTRSRKRMGK
jgi:hypothetical protein